MAARKKSDADARPGTASGAPGAPGGGAAGGRPGAPAPTVLLNVEDAVATITLNRPAQRNAISPAMIDELERALDACARGTARVVILTGAGPAFSGGMDIEALRASASQPAKRHLAEARRLAALFRALYDLPRPTIAAVNGPAIAGGCGLATLCDFVLAVPDATFGYPEVRIGFIPAIVSVFLVRQVGERRARELLLGGQVVRANEALRMSLITEVVPRERLMLRANDLAASLVSHSPVSLRETKVLLNSTPPFDLDRALEAAARASARMRETDDFREGLSAFLDKRRPRWPSR